MEYQLSPSAALRDNDVEETRAAMGEKTFSTTRVDRPKRASNWRTHSYCIKCTSATVLTRKNPFFTCSKARGHCQTFYETTSMQPLDSDHFGFPSSSMLIVGKLFLGWNTSIAIYPCPPFTSATPRRVSRSGISPQIHLSTLNDAERRILSRYSRDYVPNRTGILLGTLSPSLLIVGNDMSTSILPSVPCIMY